MRLIHAVSLVRIQVPRPLLLDSNELDSQFQRESFLTTLLKCDIICVIRLVHLERSEK